MRKLLLIYLLVAISNTSFSQAIGGKNRTVEVLGALKTDSFDVLPKNYNNSRGVDSQGAVWFNVADTTPYYHNGVARRKLASKNYVDNAISSIAGGQHTFIFKLSGVSLTAPVAVTIGVTAPGLGNFVTINVIYVPIIFSGTISVAPQISVGSQGPNYTDIQQTTTLASSPSIGVRVISSSVGGALITPPNTPIVINISRAATFSFTGTYGIDIYVQGYYENL